MSEETHVVRAGSPPGGSGPAVLPALAIKPVQARPHPRAGPARLHYVGREDPGDGHRNRAAKRPPARRGIPHARIRRTPAPAGATVVKPQIRTYSPRPPETLRNHLTHRFLRWLSQVRFGVSPM